MIFILGNTRRLRLQSQRTLSDESNSITTRQVISVRFGNTLAKTINRCSDVPNGPCRSESQKPHHRTLSNGSNSTTTSLSHPSETPTLTRSTYSRTRQVGCAAQSHQKCAHEAIETLSNEHFYDDKLVAPFRNTNVDTIKRLYDAPSGPCRSKPPKL